MARQQTHPNRLVLRFPLIASATLGLMLAASSVVVHAGKWSGTVGEPIQESSSEQLAVARHLKAIGAVFYGSWSCPACFRQMSLFGRLAGSEVPYVECRKPKQLPKQAAACMKAEVRAYPTWVLPDGDRREGIQSIEALAIWTQLQNTARP